MQRGFAPIFIIIGILIAAVAGGAYYLGTSKPSTPVPSPAAVVTSQTPQPTPSSSTSDITANWKTYTNTKYNYQLELPSSIGNNDYGSVNYGYQNFVDFKNSTHIQVFVLPNNVANNELNRIEGDIQFTRLKRIELENMKEGETKTISTGEQMDPEDPNFILRYTYKRISAKVVDGSNWFAFEIDNNYEGHGRPTIYFTNHNNSLYLIKLYYDLNNDRKLDQILSTFKFTN